MSIKTFDAFLIAHGESDTFNAALRRGDAEAQAEGNFGITHDEMIDSWLEFLDSELTADDLDGITIDEIRREAEACRDWHARNGSLMEQI